MPLPEEHLWPFVRGASEGLAMPMTILWALEYLNPNDTAWTQKETLEIHVRGLFDSRLFLDIHQNPR
jgi:mitochondrial splicing suppressor protein 51